MTDETRFTMTDNRDGDPDHGGEPTANASVTADVHRLPVRKRAELDSGRMLSRVVGMKCFHMHGYLVDDCAAEVTCAACGEKLNPIWVLEQLMCKESRWHDLHERYQDELKRLSERERTKCQHCGEMTRISRR